MSDILFAKIQISIDADDDEVGNDYEVIENEYIRFMDALAAVVDQYNTSRIKIHVEEE